MVTKLRIIRIKRGLTQREVARALGINPVVLSKIENYWLRPNKSQMAKLADYFQVEEKELFGDFAKEVEK